MVTVRITLAWKFGKMNLKCWKLILFLHFSPTQAFFFCCH
jgi:hypothetical protein